MVVEKQTCGIRFLGQNNNIVHQLIYAVYSVVKNHLLVYVINPIVWPLRSWKKRMTSLTILILAHDEKLRLSETRTRGISNREGSYSLKGKGTTDVMFHLLGRPNPLFFSPYQMADNSPQQTKVSYRFRST